MAKSRKTEKDAIPSDVKDAADESYVYMDRHMGFMRATGVVVNAVIGTGIFLSPTGIARTVGSVGATLLIWLFCGLINMLRGLVYIELGAMMPKAGGAYAFILESYGPLIAFSVVWGPYVISGPAMLVVMGRVTAQYLFKLVFPQCTVPFLIQQLTVPVVALTLAYLNCRNIYLASRIQTVFSMVKILALVIISVTGIIMLAQGRTENFHPSVAFRNTRSDPGSIAVAVLFGFFSFSGWESLFNVQEEVKKPTRTLPLVCLSSLLVITSVYVMANVAYFTVMNVDELVASPAVALTFGERSLGTASWIISVFVSISTIGFVNTYLMNGSRVIFSISREGSLPRVFSMLHADSNSPIPAIILLVTIGSFYLPAPNVYDIISFSSFISQLTSILTISCWFYFRWKRPEMQRKFKVPFVIPVIVFLLLVAMMVLAFVRSPLVYGLGLAVYLSSYPVYLLNHYLLSRSQYVKIPMDAVTMFLQRLCMLVPEKRSCNKPVQNPATNSDAPVKVRQHTI